MPRFEARTHAVIALLLAAVVAEAAAAAPPQQQTQQKPAQQPKTSPVPTSKAATSRNSKPQQTPAQTQEVEDLNNLPCERVRCSRSDQSPVCATGEGLAGCKPPEKGCTYTNGCLARCVYSARVAYLGECTHQGAMRIVEDELGPAQSTAQAGRPAPAPAASRDCKCDWKFEPVCATVPACTIPGGCTYASECWASCAGAKDIRPGACKNGRRLLEQQQALMV